MFTVLSTDKQLEENSHQPQLHLSHWIISFCLMSICLFHTVVGLSDTSLNIQFSLMFLLPLIPLAWYKAKNDDKHLNSVFKDMGPALLFAALALFFIHSRLISLYLVFNNLASADTGLSMAMISAAVNGIADSALYNAIVFGTVSGEVINLTILVSIAAFLYTKKPIHFLWIPLASLSIGMASVLCLLMLFREISIYQKNMEYPKGTDKQ